MYFGDDMQIVTYPPGLPYNEPYYLMRYLTDAVEAALGLNCNGIYLVWYNDMMFNETKFQQIYTSGNIGVYNYLYD